MGEDQRVLQIGGLAGLLAGGLFAVVLLLVLLLPLGDPDPDAFLGTLFPENRGIFTALGGLALVSYLLTVPLVLALHHTLKDRIPAYATGGLLLYPLYVGFIIVAPTELAANLVVLPKLAGQYAAGAEASAVQTLQALDLVSDQMFTAGLLFGFLGTLLFGALMLGSPMYGRTYAWIILIISLIGIATLPYIATEPGIRVPHVPHVLWVVLGWKVYSLSRRQAASG